MTKSWGRKSRSSNDNRLVAPTPEELEALRPDAVRQLVTAMLRKGRRASPATRAVAVQINVDFGSAGYDDYLLTDDLLTLDLSRLAPTLARLGDGLPADDLEALVRACQRLSTSDGPVDAAMLDVLLNAAHMMGVTLANATSMVASPTEG